MKPIEPTPAAAILKVSPAGIVYAGSYILSAASRR